MQADNIKNIPIRDYLNSQGIYPAKEYSGYGMYRSPFREDSTPSFKVDYNRNLWHDFGSGEGGSIIDLVMKMKQCPFIEAIEQLKNFSSIPGKEEQQFFSFHRNTARNSGITLMEDKPLEHPKLLEYLQSRKIDQDIAREHCREIHYSVGERNYFGIGFANNAGGYELRNPSFKGCIAPKNITHIRQEDKKASCFLFEGFLDYLSLLTIRKQLNPEYPSGNWHDNIILNSTANLQKALPLLADYDQTYCFLDNDKAGVTVLRELQKELGYRVRDASHHYSGYKDLNEYLCAGTHLKSRQAPKKPIQKPKRGLGI
ncbi:MAG: toprim domain-containing protein [Petrimonas sp.]|uniref:toprim domain-containing protein n=1 Tax=Petrimonas sp. TaxID=2023866 RepID=UPI002B3B3363|nr:toprim domain-containing protein [Petrimonas sp.]